MTPTRLRECLDMTGWSQKGLARITGKRESKIREYGAGKDEIPSHIADMLEWFALMIPAIIELGQQQAGLVETNGFPIEDMSAEEMQQCMEDAEWGWNMVAHALGMPVAIVRAYLERARPIPPGDADMLRWMSMTIRGMISAWQDRHDIKGRPRFQPSQSEEDYITRDYDEATDVVTLQFSKDTHYNTRRKELLPGMFVELGPDRLPVGMRIEQAKRLI